jgi:hypothetical protein
MKFATQFFGRSDPKNEVEIHLLFFFCELHWNSSKVRQHESQVLSKDPKSRSIFALNMSQI